MFALFLTILLAVIVFVWIVIFINLNDFSIKTTRDIPFKKILVTFPHPDDEIFTCGGFIKKTAKQGADTTLLLFTKGEKGTTDAHREHILRKIRTKEGKRSGKILGYKKVIVKDFGDGLLSQKKQRMAIYFEKLLAKENFDLVITYDLSGLYGHEDHMALSRVVTDAVNKHERAKLWYASPNRKFISKIKLPEHMAKSPTFKKLRTAPTLKIFIGGQITSKIKAFYAHRSQMQTLGSGRPFKPSPKWFYLSTLLFEYFYEVN